MQERDLNELQDKVMRAVRYRVRMKPRWYFLIGATFWFVSVVSLLLFLVIVCERLVFGSTLCGDSSSFRAEFPLWGIPIAVFGFFLAKTMLRRYDFACRFDTRVFTLGLIGVLVVAAVLLHYFGLGGHWYGV